MNLTVDQQSVLIVLTTDWQTPLQISSQLPQTSEESIDVNQTVKDLIRANYVQANPIILGMYRLTEEGSALKLQLSEE